MQRWLRHTRGLFGARTAAWLGLATAGLVSALLYWQGLAASYPLLPGLRVPRATWALLADRSLMAGAQHALVYALLMLGYVLAVWLILRLGTSRATLIVTGGGWLLCCAILLAAYPGESTDIFDYLVRGRMFVLLDASPLAVTPDAFPAQRFVRLISWPGAVDTYGPLWEYASAGVAWSVHATGPMALPRYIMGYRLLAIGTTGLCAVLIGLLVRRAAPDQVAAALLVWLWNPLLLVSTALGAHNDVLMLFFVLLTLLLVQRDQWLLGWLALSLAAQVKLTALLLLPVLGLWLVQKHGWRRAILSSVSALAVGLPVSWLLYAPLGGWATLPRMLYERTSLIYNSPANIVYTALQLHWNWTESTARQLATLGATALFGVLGAVLLAQQWRAVRRDPDDAALLWRSSAAVTLAYLLVGSFWWQNWYVLWVLIFAALLPASRAARVLLPCYALGALWSNLAQDFFGTDAAQHLSTLQIFGLMVGVQVVPLCTAWMLSELWHWVRLRKHRRARLHSSQSV